MSQKRAHDSSSPEEDLSSSRRKTDGPGGFCRSGAAAENCSAEANCIKSGSKPQVGAEKKPATGTSNVPAAAVPDNSVDWGLVAAPEPAAGAADRGGPSTTGAGGGNSAEIVLGAGHNGGGNDAGAGAAGVAGGAAKAAAVAGRTKLTWDSEGDEDDSSARKDPVPVGPTQQKQAAAADAALAAFKTSSVARKKKQDSGPKPVVAPIGLNLLKPNATLRVLYKSGSSGANNSRFRIITLKKKGVNGETDFWRRRRRGPGNIPGWWVDDKGKSKFFYLSSFKEVYTTQ